MFVKRMSMSLLAIGVIALIVSAASFALFTATSNNVSNTFTSGTVTLGTAATTVVNMTNIAPGDTGSGTFSVEYTGSLSAWLGLDTSLSGTLTTCDGGGKFTVTIGGGTYSATGSNQVIGAAPVTTGTVTNLAVAWSLASNAGNDCQNKSAQLSMTVHAVQSSNNTTGAGPTAWN